MGLVISGIQGYVDIYKMDTWAEIDFQFHLQQEMEAVRAAGRQETLTQAVRSGGFGGGMGLGGGGYSGSFGTIPQTWVWINDKMMLSLPILLFAFLIMTLVALFSGVTWFRTVAFSLFAFAILLWIAYHTRYGRRDIYNGSAIGVSLFGGVISGLTLANVVPPL